MNTWLPEKKFRITKVVASCDYLHSGNLNVGDRSRQTALTTQTVEWPGEAALWTVRHWFASRWRRYKHSQSKSVFSLLRRLGTWHCSRLPLSAVLLRRRCCLEPRRCSSRRNFSCQLGAQQQTRRTLLQRSIAGTDRRSWRTPCRYIDPVTYDTSSDSIAVPTREMKYVEKRTWNRIGLYMRNKTNGNIYFVSHLFFCKVRSVLWHCWLGARKSIRPVKIEWRGAGVVW